MDGQILDGERIIVEFSRGGRGGRDRRESVYAAYKSYLHFILSYILLFLFVICVESDGGGLI
jgi:hypothetical protein